jgi:hypothetical protein
MSQECTVDFDAKEIRITKAFGKKASNPFNVEFRTLATLHKTYPTFTLKTRTVETKHKKKSHSKLNYANMEEFINRVEGVGSPLHKEFKIQRILARRESAQYVFIKKWFLAKFPDYDITEEWIDIVDADTNLDDVAESA